jgi:carbamoyl-phosphate synthase large subunit
MPRWDLGKFHGASMTIGSEMKSVGEVMAIGRTFAEVIQKAVRMLDIGVKGLDPDAFDFADVKSALRTPTPVRIFALARALKDGMSVEEIHEITQIDPWFIRAIEPVVRTHRELKSTRYPKISEELLRRAKSLGFSDRAINVMADAPFGKIRETRKKYGIVPHIAQIDTLAAEYPAETNYLYSTYHATATEAPSSWRKKIMVLGSGAYRIGSSVEFDWCCVNAVQAASEAGYETIMLNYNPETVSTDYDVCDKLIFDEVSYESVLDIYEREQPNGVVVSMGGQLPNNIAIRLHQAGVRILGTSAESIDTAEDRQKFSALLDRLKIDQPLWDHLTDFSEARAIVEKLGGYPVLVRPSYVLSGAAMQVAHEQNELLRILERARRVSPEHPVVVSKFEMHAREVEIDAVADNGEIVLWAISEHVEDAGVHSGDATLMLPPQTLYIATIRRIKEIASALARALMITGPFNVQFLAKHNAVRVIECNLRASRSFPFVSKVTGNNFVKEATRRMLGIQHPVQNRGLDLDYVAVKSPMFSFARLAGADPMLGVEMASTGEVGCFGDDLHEALLHSLISTGFRFPKKGVLLSLGPVTEKYWFADEARVISEELKLPIFATPGTADTLLQLGIPCTSLAKTPGEGPSRTEGSGLPGAQHVGASAMDVIDAGRVDLVINVPREYDELGRPDGYLIRRRAVDAGIPLITDNHLARAVIEALRSKKDSGSLRLLAWDGYLARSPVPLR